MKRRPHTMLCHPERRRIVRLRTILRSRGTCFPPAPRVEPYLSRAPGRIDGEANNRSFDYVNALASEFVHSAQDDKGTFQDDKGTLGTDGVP